MGERSILEELEEIAASVAAQNRSEFQKDPAQVHESLLARGLDSLDFVDYLLAIEGRFGLTVSEEDIESHGLASTLRMAEFLERKLNRSSG